ncbi:MAG: aspartate/glutamate/uridylate kinase [Geminicoccaceae bacterium]
MWIVKLGGSLHEAPSLRARLTEIATVPGPARIVVPGGGPFADTVRALQPRLGVDDLAAHRMAILAMQQYGIALHSLEPRLDLAQTEAELRRAHAVVWLPWLLAGLEPAIRASWDVTSDSLAAWLAARLGAETLVLVKSAAVAAGEASATELAESGLVDAAFPAYAAAFGGTIRVVHRDTAFPGGPYLRVLASSSSDSGSSASTTSRAAR